MRGYWADASQFQAMVGSTIGSVATISARADGLSTPWPLQPDELDPWYALVERRLGLSGMHDGLPWTPDSELTNFLTPTQSEATLRERLMARWPGAQPILSRYAPPLDALEAAARTGRLQCRQGAIVREIRRGHLRGCSRGYLDRSSDRSRTAIIRPAGFSLCVGSGIDSFADALAFTPWAPGLGAISGVLGRHLMDHVVVSMEGVGLQQLSEPAPEDGRCLYLPRFDARASTVPNSGRGYGVQVYHLPVGGRRTYFAAFTFAEMLPRLENRVTLDN